MYSECFHFFFLGWNIKANGERLSRVPSPPHTHTEAEFKINLSVIVFASLWKPESYEYLFFHITEVWREMKKECFDALPLSLIRRPNFMCVFSLVLTDYQISQLVRKFSFIHVHYFFFYSSIIRTLQVEGIEIIYKICI